MLCLHRRLVSLLVLLGTSLVSAPCLAEWHEITTADTQIISDANEETTLEVASSIADLRVAISAVFPTFSAHPSRPVRLFLLSDRTLRLVGAFCAVPCGSNSVRTTRGTYIAVSASTKRVPTRGIEFERERVGERARTFAFHELTHQVLRDGTTGVVPLWLDEGAADFFSTVRRDRGQLAIGLVPNWVGRPRQWVPLRQLVSMTDDSPAFLERGNTSYRFFLESWLMMHYAQIVNRNRLEQLLRVATLIDDGFAPEQALTKAFAGQEQQFEKELQDYVRNGRFGALTRETPAPAALTRADLRPLPTLQGETLLFEMLLAAHDARSPLDIEQFEDFVKRAGRISEGGLLLAVAYELTGKPESAQLLLDANCNQGLASARLLTLCGDGYATRARLLKAPSESTRARVLAAARPYYARAVALDPQDLHALIGLATTLDGTEQSAADVRTALEAELAKSTNDPEVPRSLGRLYAAVDAQKSKGYFERAVRSAQSVEDRRTVLEELHAFENRMAKQADVTSGTPAAH